MADVVGAVVVHAVEVVAAVHEGQLGGSESREPGAELGAHAGRVVAVVYGVGEPGDAEFEFAFAGGGVEGVGGVEGFGPVALGVVSFIIGSSTMGCLGFNGAGGWLPLRVMPISPPSLALNSSLYTLTADPCATRILCPTTHGSVLLSPTALFSLSLVRPGANKPVLYPRIALHHGSLNVIQCVTLDPIALKTTRA